jgi:hypothetical protein
VPGGARRGDYLPGNGRAMPSRARQIAQFSNAAGGNGNESPFRFAGIASGRQGIVAILPHWPDRARGSPDN